MPAKKAKKKKSKSTKKKTARGSKNVKSSKKSSTSTKESKSRSEEKNILKSKKYIVLVLLIIIAGFAYLFRGYYLAALVNGQPITRMAVLQELETQSGQQVLDQLVTESLVLQEAEEQGINISQSDIDAEISEIQGNLEGQGQTLEDILALQGMSMDDLRGRIDTQLKLEELVGDSVTVEDEEVEDFIEQSSASLPEDLSAEELEELARDQLVQTKLQTEIQSYIQELRSAADIEYFGLYQPSQ